jgi:hypothetical protein
MMAAERRVIDVDESPDLIRLVDDIEACNGTTVLRRNGEERAVVTPMAAPVRRRQRPTDPDKLRQALKATAGGWQGLVDTDKLIEDIYAARDLPERHLPDM